MLATKDQLRNILAEFYSLYKDYILAIYIVGSRAVPYISTPHDTDVSIIIKRHADKSYIEEKLKLYVSSLHNTDDVDYWVNSGLEITDSLDPYLDHAWPGLNNVEPLFGKKLNFPQTILNKKDEFVYLLHHINYNNTIRYKKNYYWLSIYFILINNSYNFTEEQIKLINAVHDMTIDQQTLDKYITIFKTFTLDKAEQ